MSKPVFVYTIYIASTPEKVFKALTDTDVTAKFWFGNAVTSDWKAGAPIEFRREGKLIVQGKVLDAISKGWPLVLSSLKSYLEANRVLYAPWYDKEPAAAS